MMTQMKSRREEIATIARQDNERLGLITFVNTLVEIVVISPFHEAKIVKWRLLFERGTRHCVDESESNLLTQIFAWPGGRAESVAHVPRF